MKSAYAFSCLLGCLFFLQKGISHTPKVSNDFFGNKTLHYKVCPTAMQFSTVEKVDNLITQILKRIGVSKNRYVVMSCSSWALALNPNYTNGHYFRTGMRHEQLKTIQRVRHWEMKIQNVN